MNIFEEVKSEIYNSLKKDFDISKIRIETESKYADLAIPCFFGGNPAENAKKVRDKLMGIKHVSDVSVMGPYVNIKIDWRYVAKNISKIVSETKPRKKSRHVAIVEYSSPNISKPLHIGHLGTTIIGNSLYNIYKFMGTRTIGINYLGDWGTQFGKLMSAYKKWGSLEKLKKDPVNEMLDLYVKFHDEAKNDPSLEEEGRMWFKRLEDGDKEALKLWKMFYDYNMKDFERVYDLLNVEFDVISGESKYAEAGQDIADDALKKGIAKLSEGAVVIELGKYNLPDIMIRKSDGATTYETRDLAVIQDRWKKYKYNWNIYVVGSEQKTRFRQLFKTAELLGIGSSDASNHANVHVYYGYILGPDGKKMSTREGKIIKGEDLLNEAISRVRAIIAEKNPDLKNKEKVAQSVGVGAIKYVQLSHSREKDVVFDWDRVLSFDGNSGPYLQYTYARAMSIVAKSKRKASIIPIKSAGEMEMNLVKKIAKFPMVIEKAAREYSPNVLAEYTHDIASEFNTYYNSVPVIGSENEKEKLSVVLSVAETIRTCLNLLGMDSPKEM